MLRAVSHFTGKVSLLLWSDFKMKEISFTHKCRSSGDFWWESDFSDDTKLSALLMTSFNTLSTFFWQYLHTFTHVRFRLLFEVNSFCSIVLIHILMQRIYILHQPLYWDLFNIFFTRRCWMSNIVSGTAAHHFSQDKIIIMLHAFQNSSLEPHAR